MARIPKSGLALMTLAMLFFSLMAALAKFACTTMSSQEVVFFRSFFATLPILGIHYFHKGPRGPLFGHNRRALIGRGIVGAVALNLYFYGLAGLPLVDAMLLNQVSPLFVLPLGALLLDERINRRQLLMVPLAIIGVLMVLQPSFQIVNIPGLAALGSALFSAFAYIYIRKLAGTDSAHTVVLYFTLFSMLASAPLLPFDFRMPDAVGWLALAGVGLLSVGGQMFMTLALQYDTAGHVSMFGYFGIAFATLWDLLFWNQVPGILIVLGAVLIVGSLIEINRQGKLRVPPRPA